MRNSACRSQTTGASIPSASTLRASFFCIPASALCTLLACQSPQPHATTQPAPAGSNAELVEYIAGQAYLTADGGYRGAYLVWKGEAHGGDFESLRADLLDGRIISRTWQHGPGSYLTKGEVGFMICRALGIKTGLNWVLTELGRYAWRELQYKGIAGPGNELAKISGGEFLGILRRADEYLYNQRTREQPSRPELGKAPSPGG